MSGKKYPNITALNESIELAHLNFTDKIDITKMATSHKLNKFQFIRNFKKITGTTPAAYIILCRINHAKLLITKGAPIGKIALETGFYDHPQFCKFFKYYLGVSPSEYKRTWYK